MKDSITLLVPTSRVYGGGDTGSWRFTLTRKQVEDALTELNAPEPLKGGDLVRHVNLEHVNDDYKFLVVDPTHHLTTHPCKTWVVEVGGRTKGQLFHYSTSNLRRIE